MTFMCSLMAAIIASCAADGSDSTEPSTLAAPFDEPSLPGAPVGQRPTEPGDACRTVDDCAALERCVMGQGRFPVCVPVDDRSSIEPRGPKGQPPPPSGLLEGAPGFAGRSAGASR